MNVNGRVAVAVGLRKLIKSDWRLGWWAYGNHVVYKVAEICLISFMPRHDLFYESHCFGLIIIERLPVRRLYEPTYKRYQFTHILCSTIVFHCTIISTKCIFLFKVFIKCFVMYDVPIQYCPFKTVAIQSQYNYIHANDKNHVHFQQKTVISAFK